MYQSIRRPLQQRFDLPWCTYGKLGPEGTDSPLSDEEVIYKEEHSKLYYLRYKVEGDAEGRYAVVATTRP